MLVYHLLNMDIGWPLKQSNIIMDLWNVLSSLLWTHLSFPYYQSFSLWYFLFISKVNDLICALVNQGLHTIGTQVPLMMFHHFKSSYMNNNLYATYWWHFGWNFAHNNWENGYSKDLKLLALEKLDTLFKHSALWELSSEVRKLFFPKNTL